MTILVLATSGPAGEVGLAREGGPLAVRALGAGAARGRGLLPAVRALLDEAGLAPADLGTVVADVGPGSFTGVRVGVTAARTLAWALGRPALAVTSLEALAAAADPARPVRVLRDAGRGTTYTARFGPGAPGRRPLLEGPGRRRAAEIPADPGDLLAGDEVAGFLAARPDLVVVAVAAGAAATLAAAGPRLDAGEAGSPDALRPLYLQASAPERRRAGEDAAHPGGRADRPPSKEGVP